MYAASRVHPVSQKRPAFVNRSTLARTAYMSQDRLQLPVNSCAAISIARWKWLTSWTEHLETGAWHCIASLPPLQNEGRGRSGSKARQGEACQSEPKLYLYAILYAQVTVGSDLARRCWCWSRSLPHPPDMLSITFVGSAIIIIMVLVSASGGQRREEGKREEGKEGRRMSRDTRSTHHDLNLNLNLTLFRRSSL